METITRPALDLGVAVFTMPGQEECGDQHMVASFAGGVLVAAIDGVGHGVEAARASRITQEILQTSPAEALGLLIQRCHEALRGTRGVVMSLASFNHIKKIMTWVGVGNVQGKLLAMDTLSQPRSLLLSVGTLGHQLAGVYPTTLPIKSGDTLILTTDGVRENFDQFLNLKQAPQQLANDIMARSGRQTDDALVLVGRFLE
ncbi:MAG: SpoIIE family protein phosphatase [Gammaproteobacteria bacterium]|nr:SpoIIE family protein phosphatase [Gammaproteobacteria bacterium]